MILRQILSASGLVVHSVTARCKQRDSLIRKISLPDKSYESFTDITDIAAIRITTYFSDDVDVVARIIEREFAVLAEHSTDKRETLDPDRFGYQSLHYVATLASARCEFVEYQRFDGLKIEIQIRSILQHAWAEIEHDIGYKSVSGIPRDVRRRFARVAGLLELADAEFASIRKSLEEYKGAVVAEIRDDPAKVELDLLSLRALYTLDSNIRALDPIVADAMGRELEDEPNAVPEIYVERFAKAGIKSIDELEKAAARERETVTRFAPYWLSRPDRGIRAAPTEESIESGIGAFYLLYVLYWRKNDRSAFAKYLQENSIAVHEEKSVVDDLLKFR